MNIWELVEDAEPRTQEWQESSSSYESRKSTKGLSKRLRAKMHVDKHLSCFLKRKLVEKCKDFKAFIERGK